MKKIAIIIPREEARRYLKQYPPRGSDFLRVLEWDIVKFLSFLKSKKYDFLLIDEQTEEINIEKIKDHFTIFVYTGLTGCIRSFEFIETLNGYQIQPFIFGPFVSKYPELFKNKGKVIVGDPVNIIERILNDKENDERNVYESPKKCKIIALSYEPEGENFYNSNYGYSYGTLQSRNKDPFSIQKIYYTHCEKRRVTTVVNEIKRKKEKFIELLDEAIEQDEDYYGNIFSRLYGVHKNFKIRLSGLANQRFLTTLEKGGVKVVLLENLFNIDDLITVAADRGIRRKYSNFIKRLHSHKFTVGISIKTSSVEPDQKFNFLKVFAGIESLRTDYVEIPISIEYHKKILVKESIFGEDINRFSIKDLNQIFDSMKNIDFIRGIIWLKNRFYGLMKIWNRVGNRLPYLGFYNTTFYNLRYNFAMRQNFLEGISFPP